MLWWVDYSTGADAGTGAHPAMTQSDNKPDLDIGPKPAVEASYDSIAGLATMLAPGQSAGRLIVEAAAIITPGRRRWRRTICANVWPTCRINWGDAQALAEDQGSEIERADTACHRRHEQKRVGLQAMYDAFARAAGAMP
jgi:hypothetical protein